MVKRYLLSILLSAGLLTVSFAQQLPERLQHFSGQSQQVDLQEVLDRQTNQEARSRSASQLDWVRKVDPSLLFPQNTGSKRMKTTGSEGSASIIQQVSINGREYLAGFIAVSDGASVHSIPGFEVRSVSPSGKFASGYFLRQDIPLIASDNRVLRLQASYLRNSLHDLSRESIKVNDVHSGTGLPMPLMGEGVIVGVIDSGIDFKNQDFADENGTRIQFLLEFNENGGQEFWSKHEIDTDAENITQIDGYGAGGHGTHVTGTAAGGGRLNAQFKGMAPESDIIFVKGIRDHESDGGFADADVIEGLEFIFEKSAELGKPVVVNLSLGGHHGPLDGTSIYEQFITELQGPGRIIVAAAGNAGYEYLHAGTNLIANETTYMNIFPYSDEFLYQFTWYDEGAISQYGVIALRFDDEGDSYIVGASGWINVGTENATSEGRGILIYDNDEDAPAGFVLHSSVETQDPNNGDGLIEIYIHDGYDDDYDDFAWIDDYIWIVVFKASAEGGRFDSYAIEGLHLPLDLLEDVESRFITGDRYFSVGSPASSQKVISVGAFVSKNSWQNADNLTFSPQYPSNIFYSEFYVPEIGQEAYFSSWGPTRDGRLAPVVSAPGDQIFSTRSRDIDNEDLSSSQLLSGGHYLGMQGTSMAAPHVSGVIALMLQVNNELTYDQIVNIFAETSIRDEKTGLQPNYVFGHGRLNAHQAVLKTIELTSFWSDTFLPTQPQLMANYPNPFNPSTRIQFLLPEAAHVKLSVFDMLGRRIAVLSDEVVSAGLHQVDFNAATLSSGVYLYRLETGAQVLTRKMLLLK